jgi:hypothetical protein
MQKACCSDHEQYSGQATWWKTKELLSAHRVKVCYGLARPHACGRTTTASRSVMGSSMDGDDLYILMTYQGQTRLVERPGTLASAESRARNEFALPPNVEVKFAVDWRGRRAEISKSAFDVVARAE